MMQTFRHASFYFREKPRTSLWLIAGVVGLSAMGFFFRTILPERGSVILVGIVLITATLFCFLHYMLNNVRRAGIIAGGVGVILTLRAMKLYDPLYVLLLFAVLVSLELATRKR